jgi:hypothetical protein
LAKFLPGWPFCCFSIEVFVNMRIPSTRNLASIHTKFSGSSPVSEAARMVAGEKQAAAGQMPVAPFRPRARKKLEVDSK